MTLLFETLFDLWRLLDRRGRFLAMFMVLLLILTGVLEMSSIFFLFGYLAALSDVNGSVDPVARFYQRIAEGLEGAAFAAAAGVVLVMIFAAKNAADILTNFYVMRFAMKRYQKIATRLFQGFLELRLEVFNRRGTLDPQQILDSVVQLFRWSFTPALAALSDIAILLTMMIALLYVLDPILVLLGGAVLGAGATAFLVLTRRMSVELGERRNNAELSLRRIVLEAFRGLIDIRLGNRKQTMVDRFGRVAADFALSDRRARAFDLMPRALNEILLATGIVLAAVWFATKPGGLREALPTLAVMGFAGLRMTAAMSRLSGALQTMRAWERQRQRLMAAIRETAPALLLGDGAPGSDSYLANDLPLPAGVSGRLTNSIALERVSFTYPGAEEPALHDISLEIRRGSFVGLCGPSGSGKSTLALVVMGLLRPQQGQVRCDGWDVFSHVRAWHANIGYVGQTPFIAPGSVRENVAFGQEPEEVDDARIWRSLEAAALADVVRRRPEGLDAPIGEEGVLLSGGQRQRLAIARALYRDPEVLIFDEATAALDSVTEKEVSEAIATLSGTKTIICIAHRLSTIRRSDVVHYMERGRLVASGSYDDLERDSAAFRRMARGTELTE